MRKSLWFILFLLLTFAGTSVVRAQNRSVTGRVYNPATQEGIPGAIVSVVGGPQAAQADEQGRFRITLPARDVTLLARSIGYRRGSAKITADQATVDIALERDPLHLE